MQSEKVKPHVIRERAQLTKFAEIIDATDLCDAVLGVDIGVRSTVLADLEVALRAPTISHFLVAGQATDAHATRSGPVRWSASRSSPR